MVTKKLNSFKVVIEKKNNSLQRAIIDYEMGIEEDILYLKHESISVPLDNAKLTALVSAVETLINNQENI